ncbi:MAG TPA: phosphoribosylanthranilate isomerase [Candidatus Saccharimonadales bacterium]|nr:phosphoribosylanthranilate isomerase [Candidatus Saccharimonadales bacterium]
MKTKVKICGIRTLEHAEVAISAGVDFLGFNFVPTSKRYVMPEKAKEIINQLQMANYELRNKIVGVFQNQSADEVNNIAELVGLDFVQLHGGENDEYMQKIKTKIIKMIAGRGNPCGYPYNKTKYFLLDRLVQGEGEMVDFEKAKDIAKQFPLFFAGGLTCENVASIISIIRPFAVDVAGGIETNGLIDNEKIKQFIQNAKGVEL